MSTINIHEAKTHLSRLVEKAAQGESFVIAKAGKPMVKVAALEKPGEAAAAGLHGRRVWRAGRFRPDGYCRDRAHVRQDRVKLLLDTHLLLWAAAEPKKLSASHDRSNS